ncbi:YncE family protein [Methanocella arvoryzae]|uniref:Uncharacterized protein n=1 Tax=Methanocella arvoryzae (strain DSM 22066 / NBRC 105507 / MRE50) TaxID=351160 RepID=Q0W2S0_METAR|nr:YncE family protein [Methanocella arvoryzae]CAJ37323.1 hypothetical protein RCIX2203 [Methanocella arvoryzae MRE50]
MDRASPAWSGTARLMLLMTGCAVLATILLTACADTACAGSSPPSPQLYVCNHQSRNISIIDTGSMTVAGSIEGISSPAGVAVSPDGTILYVVGSQSGTVSAIDVNAGRVISNVKVGQGADRTVISPDGSRLYVKCGSNVSVVDTGTMQIAGTITTDGKALRGMALSPDGSRLYVADLKGGSILVIDTVACSVTETVALASLPMSLTVSPDGSRIYAACVNNAARDEFSSSTCVCLSPVTLVQLFIGWITGSSQKDINGIYIIDSVNYSVIRTINTGGIPFGMALSEDGSRLYAACAEHYGSYVTVIDPSTGEMTDKTPVQIGLWTTYSLRDGVDALSDGSRFYVLPAAGSMLFSIEQASLTPGQPVQVGADSVGMCLSPDRKKIFVASRGGNTVTIVDTGNHTTDTLKLWWDPQYIALSPDGTRAYVTSENSGTVTVINTTDRATVAIIDVGETPREIEVSPDGKKAYVTHYRNDWQTDGMLTVIDTGTCTVIKKLTVGVNPGGMAFSPAGDRLYIVCQIPALMMLNPYGHEVESVDSGKSDSLYIIDTERDVVMDTSDVRYMPRDIAVSPDGSLLYVTCMNGSMTDKGNVRVLDARSYAQTGVIDVGPEPNGIVATPDGKYLYVVTPADYSLTVIDAAAGNVTAKISFGTYNKPYGITISPRGDRVYATVGDWPAGKVVAVDTATNVIVGSASVGSWPAGLALH